MRTRFCGVLALCFVWMLQAEDWRQFRGTFASGLAVESLPPTQLSESHIQWKASLPGRGLSSPIIVGDRLFLSAAEGADQSKLVVMCFHAVSGERLWKKTFLATGRTMCHEKTCVAAPTPSPTENLSISYSPPMISSVLI